MKQKIMGLFLGITIMLAGCGEQSEQIVESIDYTPQDVSWEIAYEVPTSSANVLVDREGYATDKAKIVCFKGENLGKLWIFLRIPLYRGSHSHLVRHLRRQ